MHGRLLAASLALLGLAAAACNSAPEKPGATTPEVRTVTALPSSCRAPEAVPPGGQVSFVRDFRVYTVSPTGAGAACVATVTEPVPIVWGPAADRLMIAGFGSVDVIAGDDRVTLKGPGPNPRLQGFSRPTGVHVLFTSTDGSKLVKVPSEGGKPEDISFLRRHDEVVYHPSGAQIAVIGQDYDHAYGIYLATNEGTKARDIVPVTSQDEFYGLAFAHDGSALYYVADEHDTWELQMVDPTELRPEPVKLLSAPTPIAGPLVSPQSGTVVAFRQGDCESGFETYVHDERGTTRVAQSLGDVQPIGWLPDGTLVVGTSEDLCDPVRKLALYVVNEDKESLLVKDVDEAAVRSVVPPPPPVPQDVAGDPSDE